MILLTYSVEYYIKRESSLSAIVEAVSRLLWALYVQFYGKGFLSIAENG